MEENEISVKNESTQIETRDQKKIEEKKDRERKNQRKNTHI